METEYTLGFLAGVTWSEERIIKLLEDKRHHIKCDCECDEELITLIKGKAK